MQVNGDQVILSRQPREAQPGQTADLFSKSMQEQVMAEYRRKYSQQSSTPDSLRPRSEERFSPPAGYSDHRDHHRNFIESVRTRKPAIEDATFGFRAAGPALLANVSYFVRRAVEWDPSTMRMKG
jgi:hypothetical protein